MIAAAAAVVGAALLALTGSPAGGSTVVQVDRTWTCTSRVDLDLVKVTITRAVYGNRRLEDAVHLRPGCTGRIGVGPVKKLERSCRSSRTTTCGTRWGTRSRPPWPLPTWS